ncbi:hypothetical protein F5Y06DRAFT_257018 [Hypoxylon sp. FL0890]|nr:hypothetical protein F5Y06DRAFT_257018 [Hypoxylon sp. FL0890]
MRVFHWAIQYINRLINWRERNLRRTTRGLLNNLRWAQDREQAKISHHEETARQLQGVTTAYQQFLGSLRILMSEAAHHATIKRHSWDQFMVRIRNLRVAVQTSPLTDTRMWPRGQEDSSLFELSPQRPHYSSFA